MAETPLMKELNFLGIDDSTFAVLALLPLVQVAWADGEIQDEERELILRIADEQLQVPDEAHHLLENWLSHPPTEAYLARGRLALKHLATQDPDFIVETGTNVEDVIAFCEQVARSAGGLFGFASVHATEKLVLDEIASALRIDHETGFHWEEDEEEDEDTDSVSAEEMAQILHDVESNRVTTDGPAVVLHTEEGSTAHSLPVDAPFSIGRTRANDLQILLDHEVSRHHARIERDDDGRWWISDNGSANGTWVHAEKINKRRLYGGEVIRVGHSRLEFRLS